MMTCKEIQLRITEYVMGVLTLAVEHEEIRQHLEGGCTECLKHEEVERTLRAVSKRKEIEGN